MYVQVVTAQVRPDQLGEIERLFRQNAASAGGPALGPQAAWLLLDRETCKCLALSVWRNEAELRAGEQQERAPLAGQMALLLAGTPTRELFELISA